MSRDCRNQWEVNQHRRYCRTRYAYWQNSIACLVAAVVVVVAAAAYICGMLLFVGD